MKEAPAQSPAWFRIALATTFAALAGGQLWAVGFGEPAEVAAAARLKDDAFFYSVLVDNLREHGFVTFDGDMPTNGFQPLWFLVLAALKLMFASVDTLALLQALSWTTWLAFSWGTIWFVSQGAILTGTIRSAIVAGLLTNNTRVQHALVEGLEIPLALALLVWTLIYADRLSRSRGDNDTIGVRSGVALGALGGLVFLARTDLFWVAPVLALWVFWRSRWNWKPLLACAGAAAAMAIPYLGWNLYGHGHPVPISARVKLHYMNSFYPTWEAYLGSSEWHGLPRLFELALPKLDWDTTVIVSATLMVAANAVVWSRWGRRTLPDAIRLLAVAATAHALYMYLVYRELRPYTSYYFAPELVFVVLVFAWGISTLRGRTAMLAVAAWVLITSTARWEATDLEANGYWKSRIALAKRLPELTGGERIAAFWPGAFAGFSGLDVVPLDGVIGSEAFFRDYVQTARELDYLRERGVRWVVVYSHRASDLLEERKPRVPEWSSLGRARLWQARADLEHVHSNGGWRLFKLKDRAPPNGAGAEEARFRR